MIVFPIPVKFKDNRMRVWTGCSNQVILLRHDIRTTISNQALSWSFDIRTFLSELDLTLDDYDERGNSAYD